MKNFRYTDKISLFRILNRNLYFSKIFPRILLVKVRILRYRDTYLFLIIRIIIEIFFIIFENIFENIVTVNCSKVDGKMLNTFSYQDILFSNSQSKSLLFKKIFEDITHQNYYL